MTTTMDANDDTTADDARSSEDEDQRSEATKDSRTLLLVLGVIALVGVIGTLVFGFLWNSERSDDAAQDSMKNVASDFLLALFEFDGSTIDADFDDIMSYATGDFEEQADTVFNDEETRRALREFQAASRAEIRDIFVQSFDGDKGRVFAVVDQTIANNQNPQPRSDQLRIEVSMRKEGGDWKIAAIDVLSAPVGEQSIDAGIIPGTDTSTTTSPPTTAPGG